MGDELTLLLEVFHKIEKTGGQATLSVSTAGGKTKVKLEIAALPTVSTSTSISSTPVRRHRRRGARARARRNQRAAAHQASLVEAATSVPLDDPSRPLHILPSPPPASGRRQVVSVERSDMPTFSSLNMDGSSSPTSTPAPPSSPPPQPVCYDDCNIDERHCKTCGRCELLCIEHAGCPCDPAPEGFWNQEFEYYQFQCAVCYCMFSVRHTFP